MRALVVSIFQYASETWILTAELKQRMRCYRKILHIPYPDLVTNEDVRQIITRNIGQHEGIEGFHSFSDY